MINRKKGQGLPINVIILAALALMVLVVLVAIFTSQTSKTVSTLQSCAGVGGICTDNKKCDLDTEVEKTDVKCSKATQKCCIKVYEDKSDKIA